MKKAIAFVGPDHALCQIAQATVAALWDAEMGDEMACIRDFMRRWRGASQRDVAGISRRIETRVITARMSWDTFMNRYRRALEDEFGVGFITETAVANSNHPLTVFAGSERRGDAMAYLRCGALVIAIDDENERDADICIKTTPGASLIDTIVNVLTRHLGEPKRGIGPDNKVEPDFVRHIGLIRDMANIVLAQEFPHKVIKLTSPGGDEVYQLYEDIDEFNEQGERLAAISLWPDRQRAISHGRMDDAIFVKTHAQAIHDMRLMMAEPEGWLIRQIGRDSGMKLS